MNSHFHSSASFWYQEIFNESVFLLVNYYVCGACSLGTELRILAFFTLSYEHKLPPCIELFSCIFFSS